MAFNFAECRDVLFRGVLAALEARAEAILAIERTARGDLPITAVSFDLTPWHGGVGLSLRVTSDPTRDDLLLNSADWKYFDFISEGNCSVLRPIGEYIQKVYASEEREDPRDLAQLVFLAAAEALLDKQVALFFQGLGIDAPIFGDRFVTHFFDYIVVDPDGTVINNYCDLVVANRVTRRLLGELTEA